MAFGGRVSNLSELDLSGFQDFMVVSSIWVHSL